MDLRTILRAFLPLGIHFQDFNLSFTATKQGLARFVFCFAGAVFPYCGILAQPVPPVMSLKDSVRDIPYIFEGEIINNRLFIGNRHGEEKGILIEWQDSVGTVKEFGTSLFPFVRAEIEVTKKHKGRIRDRGPITVQHRITKIEDVWYEVTPAGDTLLRYELSPGKTLLYAFNALIPGDGFSSRRLYFCRQMETSSRRRRKERPGHYNLDIFLQIPLAPDNNLIALDRKAHPGLFPLLFFRDTDLRNLVKEL